MNTQGDQPPIEIRLAVSHDAAAIAAVLYASFVEYQPSYTQAAFTATTPSQDQIRQRMNEGPVWVAARSHLIIGTVSAVPKGDALYIRSMAVLPAAQGQGVGASLLQQIDHFAVANGYTRLWLSTTPFLQRAIRLYQHMGFQSTSEGPHDLFGTPLVTMVKML
jgi:putative acetyltransferase